MGIEGVEETPMGGGLGADVEETLIVGNIVTGIGID